MVGVGVTVGDGVKTAVFVEDKVAVAAGIGRGAAPQRLGVEIHPAKRRQTTKTMRFFRIYFSNIGIFNP